MRQDTIVASPTPTLTDTASVPSVTGDTLVARTPRKVIAPVDSVQEEPTETSDSIEPDSTNELPLLYLQNAQRDSLLANDSILFHDKQVQSSGFVGMNAQPLPSALFRNDGVSMALMSCVILTLLFLAQSGSQLSKRIKAFFMPQQMVSATHIGDTGTYEWVHLLLGCQLSMIGSLLFYSYAQQHLSVDIINLPPLALVGIFTGIIMLMLIAKQRLYHFIHAIFFTKTARKRWYEAFSIIFIFESLILFPLALLSVYFDLSPEKVSITLAVVLLFVKILLLFKCFTIFFVKIKGCLHLFMYFCALEILPLLLTWGILVEITRLFITVF